MFTIFTIDNAFTIDNKLLSKRQWQLNDLNKAFTVSTVVRRLQVDKRPQQKVLSFLFLSYVKWQIINFYQDLFLFFIMEKYIIHTKINKRKHEAHYPGLVLPLQKKALIHISACGFPINHKTKRIQPFETEKKNYFQISMIVKNLKPRHFSNKNVFGTKMFRKFCLITYS